MRFYKVMRIPIAVTLALLLPAAAHARSTTSPPALPAPTGTVVNVSTESQLQTAVHNLTSNTTIVIAPGTYTLSSTLYVNGTFTNVGLRGATNNRDDVVLVGPGMATAAYGNVPYGIWTGGNVQGITIANLTIRDLYYHPIIFNAGTQSPRVYNVHLINAGQQFIKSNPDGSGGGVNNGIVEYSVIEYTSTAKDSYTNGVDVHTASGWIIRNNLFRNIVSPPGMLAGPSVLVWNHSSNAIVEGNSFINCARGVAFGLEDVSPGTDNSGGIIRNNFFFRTGAQSGDNAIGVADSPNTQVLNNTVFLSGTYPSPIEYRFTGTTGVVIANNITDGIISARDGATGTVQSNLVGAQANLFVDASTGDLHLASTATSAIDKGVTLPTVTDDWDGEARPQGAGYDIGADERGASTTAYQIGGHVIDGSTGAALANVALTLSGARSAATTSDATGAYAFTGLAGGVDYTVTPSATSYSFSPTSAFYAGLSANQLQTDFRGYAAAANQPPTVTLSTSGTTFTAPATIGFTATAADGDGTVTKVDFYSGTTFIASDLASPYSASWANVPAGSYTFTAVATDNSGATTTSAPIAVTVSAATSTNRAPMVTLSSPVSGSTYTAPATISIVANAYDPDGRISRVRFYSGGTRIGSDTNGPTYSMTWRNVPRGSYTLTAVAIDNSGARTTSAAVTVTVK